MNYMMNTFIRTKQHQKKEKKEQYKNSLAYIYIKQVVNQINS